MPVFRFEMDFIIESQREPQDVKSRSEIRRRRRNLYGHFFIHRFTNVPSSMACFILLAAPKISSCPQTARTTATHDAPASKTRPTFTASIPPIATCGDFTSAVTARTSSKPTGLYVGLVGVA